MLRAPVPGAAIGDLRRRQRELAENHQELVAAAREHVRRVAWRLDSRFPAIAPLRDERAGDEPVLVVESDPGPVDRARLGYDAADRLLLVETFDAEASVPDAVAVRCGEVWSRYVPWVPDDVLVVEQVFYDSGVPVAWAMYRDVDTWQHESYVWDAGRLVEVVRSVDMGGGDDLYAWLQRLSWSGDRLLRCDEHRITDPYWPAESLAARVARELDDVPDLALAVLNYDDAGAFSLAGLDLAALEDMGGIEEVENWSMVPHWPRVIGIDVSAAARPAPGIDVGAYAEEVVQLAVAEHCRPDRLRARVPPLIAAIPIAADDPDAPARTALGRWQSACVVRQQLLDAQAKTDARRLQRRRDRATRRQPPGAKHS